MNYIVINKLSDFSRVLNSQIVLTGNIDEEIDENCWAITLKSALSEKISLEQLQNFIEDLLKKIRMQVAEYNNIPATCYIWVDEQSFHLQFNVISGHTKKLPFGCKLNFVNKIQPLLENFITIGKKGCIGWDDVTSIEKVPGQIEEDDDDEMPDYTIDVFIELM